MGEVQHTILPEYDKDSRILILGSFPSVKSRESKFYYGHPQNRLWKVVAAVFEDEVPKSVDEKKAFLHRHHIAMWDVIASCDIVGSADSSITNIEYNDIHLILDRADIKKIIVNGGKAYELFMKRYKSELETLPLVIKMPSTSPANAAWKMDKLLEEWSKIR